MFSHLNKLFTEKFGSNVLITEAYSKNDQQQLLDFLDFLNKNMDKICKSPINLHKLLKEIEDLEKLNWKFVPNTKMKQIDEEASCSICLEDFKLGDDSAVTKCNHIFHKSCIEEWYDRKSSCPNCRENIN